MGWGLGYDENWSRDIGYGVPARCDYPECNEDINRGLAYVCGGEPYGGDYGCGLYFCEKHLGYQPIDPFSGEITTWDYLDSKFDTELKVEEVPLCDACATGAPRVSPTPDTQEWIDWKLTDNSWAKWRDENPQWVKEHIS